MSVTIKTSEEIQKMRIAGRLAADVLEMISPMVNVGQKTGELNRICHEYIVNEQKAIPAPLNYHGFPKSICTSVNHVVCHGIPSYKQKLNDGDIINIDVTVIKDGYHGDTSKTFFVGRTNKEIKKLIASGHAYYAFDSEEELASYRKECEKRGETFIYNYSNRLSLKNSLSLSSGEVADLLEKGEKHAVRFLAPKDKTVKTIDLIRGESNINSSLLDDKILQLICLYY